MNPARAPPDHLQQEGRLGQVKGRKSIATVATEADKRVLRQIKVGRGFYKTQP